MLPSKKILAIAGLVLIGLFALGWYRFGRNSNVISFNKNTGSLSTITSPLSPNVPNFNATQNVYDPSTSDTGMASDTQNLTATDIFARDLFTQVVKLQQSGTAISSSSASQIINNYLKTAPVPTINQKTYGLNNLTLTDSGTASLKDYQTKITAIFAKYWPTGDNNEMLIIQQALTNNDPTALDSLTNVINAYQNTLDYSLKLSVPKIVADKHLAVMNALSAYIQTLKMIQVENTDPVSGIVGLKAFLSNQTNLITSTANLRIQLINSIG